jgi:hypothetical protein
VIFRAFESILFFFLKLFIECDFISEAVLQVSKSQNSTYLRNCAVIFIGLYRKVSDARDTPPKKDPDNELDD